MARKTPQEKKELSYARDRRNNGGDNAKASRKNIPLRKRLINRANRHSAQQALSEAVGIADPSLDEAVEQKVVQAPEVMAQAPRHPPGRAPGAPVTLEGLTQAGVANRTHVTIPGWCGR